MNNSSEHPSQISSSRINYNTFSLNALFQRANQNNHPIIPNTKSFFSPFSNNHQIEEIARFSAHPRNIINDHLLSSFNLPHKNPNHRPESARKTIPINSLPIREYRCYRTEEGQTFSLKTIVSKEDKDGQLKRKRNRTNGFNGMCVICKWEFPKEMNEVEKNVHINECIDGRGKEYIENYQRTLQLVNQAQDENQIEDDKKCPFCLRDYRGNMEKHQKSCAKKFQK